MLVVASSSAVAAAAAFDADAAAAFVCADSARSEHWLVLALHTVFSNSPERREAPSHHIELEDLGSVH